MGLFNWLFDPEMRKLRSADPERRAEAINQIGKSKNRNAVDMLINFLRTDKNDTVRCRAADVLGDLADPKAVEPLIEAIRTDKYDTVRQLAARALGKLGGARALETLINVLHTVKKDTHLRQRAAGALAKMGNPRATQAATEALTAAVNAGDPTVIDHLVWELAESGNDVMLAAILNYAKCVATSNLQRNLGLLVRSIAAFELEPATDFLIERGLWESLWPKHRVLVLRSHDRCRRVASLIAESIAANDRLPNKSYYHRGPRGEHYEFLAVIVCERGAAVDVATLRTIVVFQAPQPGWADEGYEKIQEAFDRERDAAYRRLLEAAAAELQRRMHQ